MGGYVHVPLQKKGMFAVLNAGQLKKYLNQIAKKI
jgi:hypothetical protein